MGPSVGSDSYSIKPQGQNNNGASFVQRNSAKGRCTPLFTVRIPG